MRAQLSKPIAFVMTLAAVLASAFAVHSTSEAKRRIGEQQASADACQAALGACTTDRATREKAIDAAASSLSASRAELDELRAEHVEAEKRLASFRLLTEKFQKMIDSGKLQVTLRNGRMVVKLPAGVLFASGSAELSKEGKDALREVAAILKHVRDRRFMVAGHTDNLPIDPKAIPPSPFKNNLELSTARALTVAQQLVQSGMNPTRLVAAGYSEHEPVRENTTEAGRQENRRIELVLMPNLTELPVMPSGDGGAPAPDAGVKRDITNQADAADKP